MSLTEKNIVEKTIKELFEKCETEEEIENTYLYLIDQVRQQYHKRYKEITEINRK